MPKDLKFKAVHKLTPSDHVEFTLEQLLRGTLSFVYPEQYHFLRFTGSLDKNGKEVCEGDIFRTYSKIYGETLLGQSYKKGEPFVENRRVVEWEKDCRFSIVTSPQLCIEVIGNIYENPDLIK